MCPPEVTDDVAREVTDRVGALDDDAVVLDVSDGWTAWRVTGPDARRAFAYVSQLPLPEDGFVQGSVAHVAAKVVVEADALTVLVPAYWRDHVRERLIHDARVTEAVS